MKKSFYFKVSHLLTHPFTSLKVIFLVSERECVWVWQYFESESRKFILTPTMPKKIVTKFFDFFKNIQSLEIALKNRKTRQERLYLCFLMLYEDKI